MRRRSIDEPDSPPQINIIAMIDVIFAILTFFIMSTLSLGRFEALSVNLPRAKTAQPQESVKATVTLDAEGDLYLNKVPLSVDDLSTAALALKESGKDLVLILNADGAVKHDRVVAVIDQIRQIEGAKLAISTQKP